MATNARAVRAVEVRRASGRVDARARDAAMLEPTRLPFAATAVIETACDAALVAVAGTARDTADECGAHRRTLCIGLTRARWDRAGAAPDVLARCEALFELHRAIRARPAAVLSDARRCRRVAASGKRGEQDQPGLHDTHLHASNSQLWHVQLVPLHVQFWPEYVGVQSVRAMQSISPSVLHEGNMSQSAYGMQ